MTHFLFEDLKVYQKSLEFIDLIHPITKRFPQLELYSLASQFRRAANSIALNIAEGSGGTKKEFIQFLRISARSLRECVVCIELAFRRKYITSMEKNELRNILGEISKMIIGLIKSLK